MKIENLTVRFGQKVVFDNFNFTFDDQGIYIINGVSGKGKTTLFNVISGILKVNSAVVDFKDKKIAYMFQEDRLFPDFTVLENVSCVTNENEEDILFCKTVLEELGLKGELDSYPQNLSGGMRRRVALARAIVFNADVILLDEPFKGLDEQTFHKAVEVVLKYSKGKLLIVASHLVDRNFFGNHTIIDI